MKKFPWLLCVFTILICSLSVACKDKQNVVEDGVYAVITVEMDNVSNGVSLLDYMNYLKGQEELTFEIKDGFITSINNVKGKSNQYWMLYTDDTANSDNSWGTCIYQEKTYSSATLGAESLLVKDGCAYIWYLQTF